jgi:hypothetical protein
MGKHYGKEEIDSIVSAVNSGKTYEQIQRTVHEEFKILRPIRALKYVYEHNGTDVNKSAACNEAAVKVRRGIGNSLYVTMVCTVCKKETEVTTTNPKLYTQEVVDKFVCLICKHKKEVKDGEALLQGRDRFNYFRSKFW